MSGSSAAREAVVLAPSVDHGLRFTAAEAKAILSSYGWPEKPGQVMMHLGVVLPILRGGRSGDDSRIDDRSLAHQQAFLGQVRVERLEDAASGPVRLEQTANFQRRRRVRRRFATQIYAYAAANRLAAVDHVFDPFVGDPAALLRNVHAQHARLTDRQAPTAIGFRVARPGRQYQRSSRCGRFDLRQNAVAPYHYLLVGVLDCMGCTIVVRWLNCLKALRASLSRGADKSVFP